MDASEGILRIGDVIEITKMSRSQIYKLMDRGEFPRQRRISVKLAIWSKSEVEAWVRRVLN